MNYKANAIILACFLALVSIYQISIEICEEDQKLSQIVFGPNSFFLIHSGTLRPETRDGINVVKHCPCSGEELIIFKGDSTTQVTVISR